MVQVTMAAVQKAWRGAAKKRGYHFGFNLKTLRPNLKSLRAWFRGAKRNRVENREGLTVSAYFTPLHVETANRHTGFQGHHGVQEIHWAEPGSHTMGTHAASVLADYTNVDAVLINHSEVIGEHGRTLGQAAKQLRMALNATVEGRTFKFITLCVGEDRATYDQGTPVAVEYVQNQVRTLLREAQVTEAEMDRIGIAYEPRFAIQVGDIPGIPPSDEHIQTMGWSILQAAAEVVGIKGMSRMFALQYGGSMKGPEDKKAPVQRFVGPGNEIDKDLYNGGLIGTAGKNPVLAAKILNRIVALAE